MEFEAGRLRQLDVRRESVATGWFTAVLMKRKRLPALAELLARLEGGGAVKRQTVAQQRTMLNVLSEAFGGQVRKGAA